MVNLYRAERNFNKTLKILQKVKSLIDKKVREKSRSYNDSLLCAVFIEDYIERLRKRIEIPELLSDLKEKEILQILEQKDEN
jgi:hypothetical protein